MAYKPFETVIEEWLEQKKIDAISKEYEEKQRIPKIACAPLNQLACLFCDHIHCIFESKSKEA